MTHVKQLGMELFSALKNNDVKEAGRLLASGADVGVKNDKGETPLHTACAYCPDMASILIAAGADVNASDYSGRTPLYVAIKNHPKLIGFLVAAGALVDIEDKCGISPLMLTPRYFPEAAGFFVMVGADPYKTDLKDKNTFLHFAMELCPELARTFLAAGIGRYHLNKRGQTAAFGKRKFHGKRGFYDVRGVV